MDASSPSVPHDLPHVVWHDSCHGLALHAIRRSNPVSDNATGLFDGVPGRGLPISSGSEQRHLGAGSLCCQVDRVVLLVRAPVARVLGPCEATRVGISMDLVRLGDSKMAVGQRWRLEGSGGGRLREAWLMASSLGLNPNFP